MKDFRMIYVQKTKEVNRMVDLFRFDICPMKLHHQEAHHHTGSNG